MTYVEGDSGHVATHNAIDVAQASVLAAAAASAASAAAAATLVGAPADVAVAAIVGNPASDTATVLSSTYGPKVGSAVAGVPGLQAQAVGRFAGVTAGGPPSTGTYLTGDFVIDQSGTTWVCYAGGTNPKWSSPGADAIQARALESLDGRPTDSRMLPFTLTTDGAAVQNRGYAMAYPIPGHLSLVELTIKNTVAGEAGSLWRAMVYDDNFGWPGSLILDAGTMPASNTTAQTWTLSTSVTGGRFVWIVFAAQNCPTTPPTTARASSSPYRPIPGSVTLGEWCVYDNTFSGAAPSVFPVNRHSSQLSGLGPFFTVRYGPMSPVTFVPDRVPVLAATETWEGAVLQEVNVYWDGARWVMIYSGGQSPEGLGWATSPTIDGPWTKQGKLLANGSWITSGRSSILFEGGTLYVYYSGSPNLNCASGPDPAHLGAPVTVFTISGTVTSVMNTSVLHDGATYQLMFESTVSGSGPYMIGYATATSPLGPFTINTFPLPTLRIVGTYGGPHLFKTGATYSLWYHACGDGSTTWNLPTDIYRATSTDLINWTPNVISKVRRTHRLEVDQVADPFVVTDPSTGIVYLFWEGYDNVSGAATIMRSVPQAMTITP